MLILAAVFVVWARMKPLNADAPPPDADDRRPRTTRAERATGRSR